MLSYPIHKSGNLILKYNAKEISVNLRYALHLDAVGSCAKLK